MRRLTSALQVLTERLSHEGELRPVELSSLLAMPLDRFALEGQLLEVRVPWLDVTLWVVPEERDAETLGREGVSRGRVWTARELMGVLTCAARTRETWRTVMLAKLTVEGDVAEVRWRGRA